MNFMRSISCLLLLILAGCGGSRDLPYVYEKEVSESNPISFSQVAIYHLESPSDVAMEEDSGGIGQDVIHFSGKSAESRVFCLALEEGENHYAQIFSDSNVDRVAIDRQNSCATIRTDSGRVKLSIFHDGISSAENIFVYEKGVSSRPIFSKEGAADSITIISATGCPSCNLENADLSNRNLRQMDFSAANLRSANLSKSNLTLADLVDADLTDISIDGAIFSRTIWNDGKVCSPSSISICDEFNFTVKANLPWQDTEILLKKDRTVYFVAQGSWTADPARGMIDPAGWSSSRAKEHYSLPGAPEAALIGRIGSSGFPFRIGKARSYERGNIGSISLVINDDLKGIYGPGLTDNFGELRVTFRIRRYKPLDSDIISLDPDIVITYKTREVF